MEHIVGTHMQKQQEMKKEMILNVVKSIYVGIKVSLVKMM